MVSHVPLEPSDQEIKQGLIDGSRSLLEPLYMQLMDALRVRDGHRIPKCSPCLSVVFLMPPGPSVRFHVFFGMSSTYVRHTDH